jgi:hypothetical protein
VATVQACSLNPQPLPPGETFDSGAFTAADATAGNPSGDDGGTGLVANGDAGHGDGAPTNTPPDDGATDGATDARSEAATDAPTDGNEQSDGMEE